MRRAALLLMAALSATAQELPSWFRGLQGMPGLDATFVQEGESSVFRAMKRMGRLQVMRGGRIRVAYDKGLLLVCDGRTLTQYDPVARSAQRLDLRMAVKDAPLLALLVDPSSLEDHYRARAEGDKVVLEPQRKGMAPVQLTGQGALLQTITWTDGTGARQTLRLKGAELKRTFPAGTFELKLPAGTRWVH